MMPALEEQFWPVPRSEATVLGGHAVAPVFPSVARNAAMMASMSSEPVGSGHRGRPIFLFGVEARSGTNFLADLLQLHPDLASPDQVWEDGLLVHAHLLDSYVSETLCWWRRRWPGIDASLADELAGGLGTGLLRFLEGRLVAEDGRLLSKTPVATNLPLVRRYFPTAQTLLLVRDGRAVVASGMRSFGWHLEEAARWWSTGARTILEHLEREGGANPSTVLVRYEDLCADVVAELSAIFEFLDLDPRHYDFDAAAAAPVRGSSLGAEGGSGVHWTPVARPADFHERPRFDDWTPSMHKRFLWIAGEELAALGYIDGDGRPGGPGRLMHVARDQPRRVRGRLSAIRGRLRGLVEPMGR